MMKPSSRLDLIPPYLFSEISRIKNEAIKKGADIIDLGIGDPDQPTPHAIIEVLKKAAEKPIFHRYDESARGYEPFLKAAIYWLKKEFGVDIDIHSEIGQVIGSKEGLAHLCWSMIEPGDISIVPNPGYTVYGVNTLMAGGSVYETPLLEKNQYLPVLEDIPTDIAKKAKLFFVCYPHNPTGATCSIEYYKKLIEFCKDYNILAVSDLAYAGVTFDDYKSPSILQVENSKNHAIEFHSLSKSHNMTGWRIGFAAGNQDAVAALMKIKSNIDSKQFPAISEAAAYALKEVVNRHTLSIYTKRRDILCDGLAEIGWNIPKPKASFYLWAKIPNASMNSATFAKELLEKSHILTIPGSGYGEHGEGYVRMALSIQGDTNGNRCKEAVKRIASSGLINVKYTSVSLA